jgi:hypothetical protein
MLQKKEAPPFLHEEGDAKSEKATGVVQRARYNTRMTVK